MKLRMFTVSLLLALLLASFAGVGAQDAPVCYGLSDADCALLNSASGATVTSFTQNFTFDLSITGIAMMDPSASDVSIHAEGSGPFVLDMAKMTPENPMGAVNLAMDLSGSISAPEAPPPGEFTFMIVDGVLYLKNPNGDAWVGVNLGDAMQAAGVNFDDIMSAASSGVTAGASAGMNMDMSSIDFITQTRGEDMTVDGMNVAHFTTSVDIGKLLASPTFTQALSMAGDVGSSMGGGGNDSADMQQAMMMIPMLASAITGNFDVVMGVGTEDSLPHHFAIVSHIELNLGAMMGASGSDAAAVPPIALDLTLHVDMTGVNATESPVAPEGATMMSAEDFANSMGG